MFPGIEVAVDMYHFWTLNQIVDCSNQTTNEESTEKWIILDKRILYRPYKKKSKKNNKEEET
jgi:hypothetical protein